MIKKRTYYYKIGNTELSFCPRELKISTTQFQILLKKYRVLTTIENVITC